MTRYFVCVYRMSSGCSTVVVMTTSQLARCNEPDLKLEYHNSSVAMKVWYKLVSSVRKANHTLLSGGTKNA